MSEDYLPLDAIRSSHGMQRRPMKMDPIDPVTGDLFEKSRNTVSDTAWACVVYSMVPYIGILFIPLAFVTGGIGYAVSKRRPQLGGGRMATMSVGLSLLILAVQIMLWWLLYIIPEIGI
jgi:hypothetical protein